MQRLLLSTLLAALFVFPACSDSDSDSGGDMHETGEHAGDEGTIAIEAMWDGDPAVGQNTLMVTLTMDDEPFVGATLVVNPQMPSMGHGSSETPEITDNGDGTYTAAPVTLQMPGEWVIHINAQAGDDWGHDQIMLTVQ